MNPPCRDFDTALLAAAGNPEVVRIIATAVVRNGSVSRSMRQAERYFGGLGAGVEEVKVHRRSDASRDAVVADLEASPLTYLLGGDPGYLLDTLVDTPAWDAIRSGLAAGRALAGSSAGAMVVCETLLLRSPNPSPSARHGKPGLSLLPGVVLIPHLNRFAPGWLESARREARGRDILGLDESTGLLYAGGWRALGPGLVRLWRRGQDPAVDAAGGRSLRWRRPDFRGFQGPPGVV
jgi:cyanophycinase